ncbi:MAG: hypothetical protein ACK58L_11920 [Planctomycetota bacterium]
MSTDPLLPERKRRVGIAAAACLAAGVMGLAFDTSNSFWPAAGIRVGIVLGALWLCLPVQAKTVGWNWLTREKLAAIVVLATFIHRIKVLIPLLIVLAVLIWIARPKIRR